jgi:hypothetical protein
MNYVNMTEALRQVREATCPKCEGESCECPQNENTLEITNADKAINSTAYQNYKSGDEHYHPAEDLEEQKKTTRRRNRILIRYEEYYDSRKNTTRFCC